MCTKKIVQIFLFPFLNGHVLPPESVLPPAQVPPPLPHVVAGSVVRGPNGVVPIAVEDLPSLDIVSPVRGEAVVDPGGDDHQVAGNGLNADPPVLGVADVEEAAAGLDVPEESK